MGEHRLYTGRVVTPTALIKEGAVVTAGETIEWVGNLLDLPGKWQDLTSETGVPGNDAASVLIFPGLVDVHCHGGGGESFPDSVSVAQVETAAKEHLRHGTTTLVASLVTAAIPVLEKKAALLADAVDLGIIEGIHFEGPFLSKAQCGAQNPAYLVPATPAAATKLVQAARGHAAAITVAPEHCLDEKGREAIAILVAGGILPSWGHSDCTLLEANAAVALGVNELAAQPQTVRGGKATVTHLFNGMPPMHHRAPGPIPAFLTSAAKGQVIVEMINDGVHLDPLLVKEIVDLVGRENCVFVTDAMAAAGMSDGRYVLGPQEVKVEDGVARLVEGDNLAGGTSHLLDQVKVAVQSGGFDLVDAVYLASAAGAAVLGLQDRGRISHGAKADLVCTTDQFEVLTVVRSGVTVL